MSNDIFFLAEFSDGRPARSALELAAGASQLASAAGGQAVALAYGDGAAAGAAGLGAAGAARAVVLGDERRAAIAYAPTAAAALEARPRVLLAPATPEGRDIAAALVGLLNLPAFAPVRAVRIEGDALHTEQATLQGSVVTVSTPADGAPSPALVLVLPNTFTPLEGGTGSAEVSDAPAAEERQLAAVTIVESHVEQQAAANLEEAETIVAGGRGVGGPDGFELLQQLADALGNAAVGASRAAADAGWVPYQLQIGQTGKVVKPSLYLACGISGAIQHRVGMQTAQNVVAINRDADAPIGEFADLFVVGDLFQIVPKLIDELKRRKGK
jgi:electron transfer flavoprotein alpha subunit